MKLKLNKNQNGGFKQTFMVFHCGLWDVWNAISVNSEQNTSLFKETAEKIIDICLKYNNKMTAVFQNGQWVASNVGDVTLQPNIKPYLNTINRKKSMC